jgi:hypothetical protein
LLALILGFVAKTLSGNFSEVMYDRSEFTKIKDAVSSTIETVKNG